MSLHTKYASQLSHHPFGHALYHPKTVQELRPGLCGYFDHHGHWQPIVDLTSESDLAAKSFTPIALPPRAPKGPYTEWGPICSSNIHSKQVGTALGVSASAIGAPVGGQVQFEFSTGGDTAAMLLTEAPVEQDGFYHRQKFLDWCKENQDRLLKYAPEVANADLWIVSGVYTTPRCSLTVAEHKNWKVNVGFEVEAAVAGKLQVCRGWEVKMGNSAWLHAGRKPSTPAQTKSADPVAPVADEDRVVVFISGLHFRFRPKAYFRKPHFNESQEKRGFLDSVLDMPVAQRRTALVGLTMVTVGVVWMSMYYRYNTKADSQPLVIPSMPKTVSPPQKQVDIDEKDAHTDPRRFSCNCLPPSSEQAPSTPSTEQSPADVSPIERVKPASKPRLFVEPGYKRSKEYRGKSRRALRRLGKAQMDNVTASSRRLRVSRSLCSNSEQALSICLPDQDPAEILPTESAKPASSPEFVTPGYRHSNGETVKSPRPPPPRPQESNALVHGYRGSRPRASTPAFICDDEGIDKISAGPDLCLNQAPSDSIDLCDDDNLYYVPDARLESTEFEAPMREQAGSTAPDPDLADRRTIHSSLRSAEAQTVQLRSRYTREYLDDIEKSVPCSETKPEAQQSSVQTRRSKRRRLNFKLADNSVPRTEVVSANIDKPLPPLPVLPAVLHSIATPVSTFDQWSSYCFEEDMAESPKVEQRVSAPVRAATDHAPLVAASWEVEGWRPSTTIWQSTQRNIESHLTNDSKVYPRSAKTVSARDSRFSHDVSDNERSFDQDAIQKDDKWKEELKTFPTLGDLRPSSSYAHGGFLEESLRPEFRTQALKQQPYFTAAVSPMFSGGQLDINHASSSQFEKSNAFGPQPGTDVTKRFDSPSFGMDTVSPGYFGDVMARGADTRRVGDFRASGREQPETAASATVCAEPVLEYSSKPGKVVERIDAEDDDYLYLEFVDDEMGSTGGSKQSSRRNTDSTGPESPLSAKRPPPSAHGSVTKQAAERHPSSITSRMDALDSASPSLEQSKLERSESTISASIKRTISTVGIAEQRLDSLSGKEPWSSGRLDWQQDSPATMFAEDVSNVSDDPPIMAIGMLPTSFRDPVTSGVLFEEVPSCDEEYELVAEFVGDGPEMDDSRIVKSVGIFPEGDQWPRQDQRFAMNINVAGLEVPAVD